MMNYNTFKTELIAMVEREKECRGLSFDVEIRQTFKINSANETINLNYNRKHMAMPNFYVDSLFERYSNGESIMAIVNEMISMSMENPSIAEGIDLSIESFMEKVVPAVINAERNEEFLKGIPHRRLLDLAVIYRVVLDTDEDGAIREFTVTNQYLEGQDYSEEDLFARAFANLGRMGIEFSPMHNIGVLTTGNFRYGASALMIEPLLEDIAEKGGDDLYIIPSSIHELFIVCKGDFEAEGLKGALREAERTGIVGKGEWLSNNLYIFSRHEGLRIA